jgi:DNA-binding Lrp family transcriptional regulator
MVNYWQDQSPNSRYYITLEDPMASPAKNVRRDSAGHPRPVETLDGVDRQIIDALVADARITNRDLADAVGIAPSTALMRTRSLMERGAIEGFEAKLNLAVIGRAVQALIAVRLRAHDRDQIDAFTSRVPKLPEVLSTFHTSGSVDYLLHIAVRDTNALRDWVLDNLTTDPVVGHTETTLVFKHMPGHTGPLD